MTASRNSKKSYSRSIWLLILSLTFTISSANIKVEEKAGQLTLTCELAGNDVNWKRDGIMLDSTNKNLVLGRLWDDPRGVYICNTSTNKAYLDVYVRMCQYCIELDTGTVSGFIVADLIMIVLIAAAVYCVSGSETRRPARASDKQNLIQNDSLYQHLGERQDAAYSHLTPRKI
ncbi:T-cell surface glycoprotein CD3 gamma chain [Bombina bombina]|uniref:T-cell surface glycoprotein CD3 gamma chain n=1 Tax=Bombina bombina TaxID=8345 RepID=UPI00235AC6A9|nr:T-cell surface glycoprotein CD3 gamma chain [Bombina bombina]